MYPLRFEKISREYIWGSESWELSDRIDAASVLVNGPLRGCSLEGLLRLWNQKLLGVGRDFTQFPLLIKIIEAKENLSLQVHPDEKRAALFNGEPKSESWVMLETGNIYAGLKKGVARSSFFYAVQNNTVSEWVESQTVQSGDVFYIPAGVVHAIGGGSTLLEVQQNSNTTYRLYDWGRSSRKLHIEEALASIDWDQTLPLKIEPKIIEDDSSHQLEKLIESPYFIIERLQIKNKWNIPVDKRTFQILFCQKGSGTVAADGYFERLVPNSTYLLPAAIQTLYVEGECQLIRIKLP